MSKSTDNTSFMEVSSWKSLLGINKLNLSYNPDTDKFCLQIDNTRQYIRIDADLVVVNTADKTKSRIDTSKNMALRIDDDDATDLDGICLVAVKASKLVICDSI